MVSIGSVVRASNWPGTHGERFLVREFGVSPHHGPFAWCMQFDGATPLQWRALPLDRLTVDQKATRKYLARTQKEGQ